MMPFEQFSLALGAVGLGLLIGWVAFNVAEFAEAYPHIFNADGCRGGACKLS
jgi:hypothetical protein